MMAVVLKKILLLTGVAMVLALDTMAQQKNYFETSPGIVEAYENIKMLKLDKAQHILDSLKVVEPHNMTVYHIENYIDFFRVFINEDYEEFVALEKNGKYRIKKIKSGDKNSPYYRFALAEVKLQWALSRSKFEEFFKAIREINSALSLLTENKKLFPGFALNNKSLSVIHAYLGTLTGFKARLLRFLSSNYKGTIQQGAEEIKTLMDYCDDNYCLFKDEVYTIASYIAYFLENDKNKAWEIIEKADLDTQNSPLACFVVAGMAQKTGKNDYAIEILLNKPESNDRLPFYYLDYMLGKSKLYRMDSDALSYLNKFVNNFSGINYIKDAYLKIAWYHYLFDEDKKGYKANIKKCISYGYKLIDEDKSAYKEARKRKAPDYALLKARLLFDGAYYKKALHYLLQYRDKYKNAAKPEYLEYQYRMGRILQMLNEDEAADYFLKTIEKGKKTKYYFACNAALQLGTIYEAKGRFSEAEKYYNLCLDLNPEEYKNSLHQRAVAGLERIKQKTNTDDE